MESGPKSLFELIKPLPVLKKKSSERSELLSYFQTYARDRNNKPLTGARLGVLLSPFSLNDLYAFKSRLEDRRKTQVGFQWNKMFWGSIKGDEKNTPTD